MKKEIQPVLELCKEEENLIALVGWHNPWADITTKSGEQWEVKIAGGCQAIWLRRKGGPWFSVSVSEIVQEMMQHIPQEEK